MTRLTAVSALLLALTLPTTAARADEASQRAKAEEMMALLHTQKTVEQIAGSITRQVDDAADQAAGPDATDAQKAKAEDFKKQAGQMIDTQLGWASMKSAIRDLYVKNFTEDQLDAILAFYKTPAGAALLEKLPEINSQFGQIGNTRVNDLKAQLQKAYLDFQQSLHPIPTLGPPSSSGSAAPAPQQTPAAPGTPK